jgi:hypothetical protein
MYKCTRLESALTPANIMKSYYANWGKKFKTPALKYYIYGLWNIYSFGSEAARNKMMYVGSLFLYALIFYD